MTHLEKVKIETAVDLCYSWAMGTSANFVKKFI